MRIVDIIWLPNVIDKLDWKHNHDMDKKERRHYERG